MATMSTMVGLDAIKAWRFEEDPELMTKPKYGIQLYSLSGIAEAPITDDWVATTQNPIQENEPQPSRPLPSTILKTPCRGYEISGASVNLCWSELFLILSLILAIFVVMSTQSEIDNLMEIISICDQIKTHLEHSNGLQTKAMMSDNDASRLFSGDSSDIRLHQPEAPTDKNVDAAFEVLNPDFKAVARNYARRLSKKAPAAATPETPWLSVIADGIFEVVWRMPGAGRPTQQTRPAMMLRRYL